MAIRSMDKYCVPWPHLERASNATDSVALGMECAPNRSTNINCYVNDCKQSNSMLDIFNLSILMNHGRPDTRWPSSSFSFSEASKLMVVLGTACKGHARVGSFCRNVCVKIWFHNSQATSLCSRTPRRWSRSRTCPCDMPPCQRWFGRSNFATSE